MMRRPQRYKRTDTLIPSTTLFRSPVIISSDNRKEKLRQSQAAIQDQHQPERLPNLLNVQDPRLHECADKSIPVHESHEIEDHQRHGEQAIIGRIKETNDNKRTRPGNDLTDDLAAGTPEDGASRSEEHTSELQSLMRISYAVFCLKKKKTTQ